MRFLIFIISVVFTIQLTAQDRENWRLFPGKTESAKQVSLPSNNYAQIKELDFSQPDGIVEVKQDTRIDSLTSSLKKNPYILGYTVQLEVSQQNSKIRDARYRLLKLKPNAPIEENYAAPNTYLYGGAFYSRTDAFQFKNEIKGYFPNAIVIARKLALPPLKNN